MREQKILNLCAALVIPPVNGRELFRSSIKWLIKPENASKCAISRCFSFKKFSKKKFDDFANFFRSPYHNFFAHYHCCHRHLHYRITSE